MIVTNNQLIQSPDIFVPGNFRDVLIRVRDLVYEGHELLTSPLFASIRMQFSPVRTIILSDAKIPVKDNFASQEMMACAIEKYDSLMAARKPDERHYEDYQVMDKELFLAALCELREFDLLSEY